VSLRPHVVLLGITLNMLTGSRSSVESLCYCVSVSKSLLLLFSGCSSLELLCLLLFTLTEWSLTSEDTDTLDAVLPSACLLFAFPTSLPSEAKDSWWSLVGYLCLKVQGLESSEFVGLHCRVARSGLWGNAQHLYF